MDEADRIVTEALQAECDHPMASDFICDVCGATLPGDRR
jgi:hypothetical protein